MAGTRIVSWNMNGRAGTAGWRHLLDVLEPDIALLQEAVLHPEIVKELGDRLHWERISGGQTWGTAVVATSAVTPVDVGLSAEWQDCTRIVAADATIGETSFRLVSVHPSEEAVAPALAAERPELAAPRPGARHVWPCDVAYAVATELVAGGEAFVVGGDWNTGRLFETTRSTSDQGTGADVFARAEADGWHECYFRQHRREGRTWFHTGHRSYQLDHVFTDAATGATVRDCWIDERAAALAPTLSDHAPVIVELTS